MKKLILFVCLASTLSAMAQSPVISAYANGEITWTNTVNTNSRYRVEWASSLDGNWIPLPGNGGVQFRGIEAGTGTVFSAKVPMFFRVMEYVELPYDDMVLIPGGTFMMGDSFNEGAANELPVHEVSLDAYWLGQTQVTAAMWTNVYQWATNNGYDFTFGGHYYNRDDPVALITWYDAVKWCNAKSEKEGRTPVYYIDIFGDIYRTNNVDLLDDWVFWNTDGYRLPTEAEWEFACRGGIAGRRFPWGNTISHQQASYISSVSFAYDISRTRGTHPLYGDKAAPAHAFPVNAFGLKQMCGNVSDWCWDYYGTYPSGSVTNPHGPANGTYRLYRGGNFDTNAPAARNSVRNAYYQPNAGTYLGFRLAVTVQ